MAGAVDLGLVLVTVLAKDDKGDIKGTKGPLRGHKGASFFFGVGCLPGYSYESCNGSKVVWGV